MTGINAAQLRKWVLVGLVVGAAVSALLGALPICDYGKGLALNLATELVGGLVTYVLLQLVIGRKEEEEAKKADLIAQMGSSVKHVAVAAVEELRRHGWLYDGSLREVDLDHAKLPGVDLTGADLQGARLQWADLQEVILKRANLRRADLWMANLQGVRLQWADLQGAKILANLQGAKLRMTNLEGADLSGCKLQEAILLDVNLQGASLKGADLQGANLFGANLQGTILEHNTVLPDGTKWTPDTDMARFTDPRHPDFWSPGA